MTENNIKFDKFKKSNQLSEAKKRTKIEIR